MHYFYSCCGAADVNAPGASWVGISGSGDEETTTMGPQARRPAARNLPKAPKVNGGEQRQSLVPETATDSPARGPDVVAGRAVKLDDRLRGRAQEADRPDQ